MTLDELKSVVAPWRDLSFSAVGVTLRDRINPPMDPHDDYRVIHEVLIEPAALDKMRMEIWLTASGHVAVGMETRDRVAQRLGSRTLRKGFAAGHEPTVVSPQALAKLIQAVSQGRLAIGVSSLLGFIYSTKGILAQADLHDLKRAGYDCEDWTSRMVGLHSFFEQVVRYRSWTGT